MKNIKHRVFYLRKWGDDSLNALPEPIDLQGKGLYVIFLRVPPLNLSFQSYFRGCG